MPVSGGVDRSPISLWDSYWKTHHIEATASPIVHEISALLGEGIASAKILEVGAGSGRDVVALATLGSTTYAVDRSEVARSTIAERAASQGVDVHISGDDLRDLQYADGEFDVVYSQGVVEHFEDVDSVVGEQLRVTRPGGHLIIDVPQSFNPYTVYKHALMLANRWPAGWEREFSPHDMREIARRHGMTLVRMYGWGEHSPRTQPILGLLDRWVWTATCVGAIYCKR